MELFFIGQRCSNNQRSSKHILEHFSRYFTTIFLLFFLPSSWLISISKPFQRLMSSVSCMRMAFIVSLDVKECERDRLSRQKYQNEREKKKKEKLWNKEAFARTRIPMNGSRETDTN